MSVNREIGGSPIVTTGTFGGDTQNNTRDDFFLPRLGARLDG